MDGPPEGEFCTICHDNFHLPYQANCTHWFCGNCLLQLWEHGPTVEPCKCPLCRRSITLLVPSGATFMQQHTPDVSRILKGIERYNRLCGERSTIWQGLQTMQDLPFLIRRLSWDIVNRGTSFPRVIKIRIFLAFILGLIYWFSPIEIISWRVIGIFGMLDDLIVLFMIFMYLAGQYRTFLLARHEGSGD